MKGRPKFARAASAARQRIEFQQACRRFQGDPARRRQYARWGGTRYPYAGVIG